MNANPSPQSITAAQTAIPQKRSRVRQVLAVLLVLAVMIGGFFFYDWYANGRFIERTDNAYLRADKVSMAPVVSGKIDQIYVADNQEVVAGQPLLKIDPRRYEFAMREARATVDGRKAELVKSQADLASQASVIAQAQADLESAAEDAKLAQKDFDRMSPLAARGVESQQKVERARTALDQAGSITHLKQAVLDEARQQTTALKAQVEKAQADLAAARESLGRAEIDLEDTVLRAAISGRLGDRTAQLGQFVQPGTPLLTIVPTDDIYLVANFKETQIADMRAGQPVRIDIDAYPDLKLTGIVDSFAPGTGAQFALLPPENATGNFTKIVQRVPVRIRLEPGPTGLPPLLPGLSIEVSVDTGATEHVKLASGQ
ncbi:HlyD family secretion protein [Paracoccus sp. PAR01]|uniref:HlyD family secretion protein n=1 Tax=Paracoccus sp. PAR01 TaxID=2769282 RepID=UPI00178599DE|nr:HlyD family secretion protein [Paracoccus sp. PAR01]MBD9528582.1 HlyD family secretion protein [Paracoccus sp. PAR01]